MKKLFKYFGIIFLVTISFFYSEKSMMVVREYDDIMIKLKQEKNIDEVKSIIDNDTIIAGTLEKKVNITKSYKKMKYIGNFNSNLIIYDAKKTKYSLDNNLDKYILGSSNNSVSLIFKLNNNSNIDYLINILNKYNLDVNFVYDKNNIDKLNKYVILNSNNNFNKQNSYIKYVLNQDKLYCYFENKNDNLLNICLKNRNYSILPIIIKNNYIFNTKKYLKKGIIISYEVNSNLEKELEIIIKYINSKGYRIVNLIEHLKE